MKTVSPATRNRLEAQGFVGLDDATLADVGPWLRLSPAICMIWAAIGLGHWLGTQRLPRYRAPRRFACAVATIWLGAAGLAFYLGSPVLGYVLGGSLTLAALVPVTTDFCIPSFFWGLMFGKPLACGRN